MRYLVLASLLLGGCSYHLGNVTAVPDGKTVAEARADGTECREQAKAAVTPGKEVAYYVAGLSLVGVPAAISDKKATTRPVWVRCMQDRGYTVEDATD